MNEIYKGMDNAAEQIDNNFKGIKDYVIEQGENQRGWWEKWASGKLVQYGAHMTTVPTAAERWGNVYLTAPTRITFPIEFYDIYTLDVTLAIDSGDSGWLTQYDNANYNRFKESPRYSMVRPIPGYGDAIIRFDFMAIGRWK